jgi:hypothetical protein
MELDSIRRLFFRYYNQQDAAGLPLSVLKIRIHQQRLEIDRYYLEEEWRL